MDRIMKVVWICRMSNSKVREMLKYSKFYFKRIVPLLLGRHIPVEKDAAVWNSNAVREFEKYKDIELTIISFQPGIAGHIQTFTINGITYVCVRPQDDNFFSFIKRKISGSFEWNYKRHRRIVSRIINNIQPDIVHLIGAENPQYSVTLLDCPNSIPTVTSLQTLMSAPGFLENYPLPKDVYEKRSSVEKEVIKRSDYIAQKEITIRETILRDIKPDAVFLQMVLAVGVEINADVSQNKEYDFVYFSNSVDKAADVAIEAFA